MRALHIDSEGQTAWAQTGLTAGDYTATAAGHGLATGFGDTGSVGIGGLTLAGGIGFLVRKHGLTIDALLSAELVTADGRLLRVNDETYPDIFWALRGGGGNFGVATRLKFRLHKVDAIVGGTLILPATPDVITSFIAEAEGAPDELSTIVDVMPAPPMPFIPAEHRGRLVVMALMVYAGAAGGERRCTLSVTGYSNRRHASADALQGDVPADEGGHHPIAAARTMFIDAIDRATAETIVENVQASTAPMRAAQIRVLGGAMGRVPVGATAFAHRKSPIMVNVGAVFQRLDEAPIHEAWAADFDSALRQHDRGAYVNFLGDEGPARVRAAYPGSTWERLVAIKRRYDPTNLFRLNQNIPPTGA